MRDYVLVLNDGETYTNLAGCKIFGIDDGMSAEQVESTIELRLPDVEFDVLNGKPHLEITCPITIDVV